MTIDVVRYGITNVFRRLTRSVFAVIGIGVGVAALIAIVAVSQGLLDAINAALRDLPCDVLVIKPGTAGLETSKVGTQYIPQIEQVDGVDWVEPVLFQPQMFQVLGDGQTLIPVYGMVPGGKAIEDYPIVAGAEFSDTNAGEVLIGYGAAKIVAEGLGIEIDDLVGIPWPVAPGRVWTIVGVFKTGQISDIAIAIPYGTASDFLAGEQTATALLVGTKRGADIDAAIAGIHALAPQALEATRPAEFMNRFNKDVDRARKMIFALGFIAVLAGAVGVLNTMVSNVHERTREIGLLLAVGWRRVHMMSSILVEGAFLSIVGGIVALPISWVLIQAAGQMMDVNPVPEGIHPAVPAMGMAVGFALGTIGSGFAAFRAARLSPIEALREM
jgi:ABC-type antimicrobial peptide transport system permease subunit